MPSKLPLFVALLILSSLLFVASAAQAVPTGPIDDPLAFEEELEYEDEVGIEGEEETNECEEAEGEFEEGELSQSEVEEICDDGKGKKKATGSGSVAPEECLLKSARAHAIANEDSDKLKLTLGYTTYKPVNATIEIGHITTLHRHLGRSGILRIVKNVGETHPKRLVVSIKLRAVKSAGCPFRRLVLFPR